MTIFSLIRVANTVRNLNKSGVSQIEVIHYLISLNSFCISRSVFT